MKKRLIEQLETSDKREYLRNSYFPSNSTDEEIPFLQRVQLFTVVVSLGFGGTTLEVITER